MIHLSLSTRFASEPPSFRFRIRCDIRFTLCHRALLFRHSGSRNFLFRKHHRIFIRSFPQKILHLVRLRIRTHDILLRRRIAQCHLAVSLPRQAHRDQTIRFSRIAERYVFRIPMQQLVIRGVLLGSPVHSSPLSGSHTYTKQLSVIGSQLTCASMTSS